MRCTREDPRRSIDFSAVKDPEAIIRARARVWFSDWCRFATIEINERTIATLRQLKKVDGIYLATHPDDYNELRPHEVALEPWAKCRMPGGIA